MLLVFRHNTPFSLTACLLHSSLLYILSCITYSSSSSSSIRQDRVPISQSLRRHSPGGGSVQRVLRPPESWYRLGLGRFTRLVTPAWAVAALAGGRPRWWGVVAGRGPLRSRVGPRFRSLDGAVGNQMVVGLAVVAALGKRAPWTLGGYVVSKVTAVVAPRTTQKTMTSPQRETTHIPVTSRRNTSLPFNGNTVISSCNKIEI